MVSGIRLRTKCTSIRRIAQHQNGYLSLAPVMDVWISSLRSKALALGKMVLCWPAFGRIARSSNETDFRRCCYGTAVNAFNHDISHFKIHLYPPFLQVYVEGQWFHRFAQFLDCTAYFPFSTDYISDSIIKVFELCNVFIHSIPINSSNLVCGCRDSYGDSKLGSGCSFRFETGLENHYASIIVNNDGATMFSIVTASCSKEPIVVPYSDRSLMMPWTGINLV